VTDAGYADWEQVLVHGDWHPGNLLYRDGAIVAVLDFDSARLEPRLSDVANAALQFSMQMQRPEDPASWPDGFDARRIRSLLRGYDQARAAAVTPEERQALPWLMVEALIVESVIPIAATGTFARVSGAAFLQMVERKVRWLRPRQRKLVDYIDQPQGGCAS
jgi:Ser/Thr protein kinase RdoA (MazF antagonist)